MIGNFLNFSEGKVLFPYQIEALESIYQYLKLFFGGKNSNNNLNNRASFWMATGSGKTLVIVKLIELLRNMMDAGEIEEKDILFLTARDDLVEQFLRHVEEFNSGNNSLRIETYSLKEYERIKKENRLSFQRTQRVFYYRSDLFSDENKDKIVDYKTYDNDGNWYIILDEAHKGDQFESKRKQIFEKMTRNGFLFNFSATFTDKVDIETCIYNFNLERFIQSGYGKDIYVSEYDIRDLGSKEEWTERRKREITLRILILLSALKKIKQEMENYYHKPMLVALVNSVNTEDSDLEMFFRVIEEIAEKPVDEQELESLKRDLVDELQGEKTEFAKIEIPKKLISKIQAITDADLLEQVFNAKSHGQIEVKVLSKNRQELVLSLKTTSRPFALIKIGDITNWIKEKLKGYEIVESFDNESVFKQINSDDSDINLLLGSRSFYEGWDSSRPNIILYINIGKQDAQKFVLQSIGRGVRINPFGNHRKRWEELKSEISYTEYSKFKDHASALETLFVYGTRASNVKEIIKAVKSQNTQEVLTGLFGKNSKVESKTLLRKTKAKVKLSLLQEDFDAFVNYFKCLPEVVFLVKYGISVAMLRKIKESLEHFENYYDIKKADDYKKGEAPKPIGNPDLVAKLVINHLSTEVEDLEGSKRTCLRNLKTLQVKHLKQPH